MTDHGYITTDSKTDNIEFIDVTRLQHKFDENNISDTEVEINTSDLISGVYIISITMNDKIESQDCNMVKDIKLIK